MNTDFFLTESKPDLSIWIDNLHLSDSMEDILYKLNELNLSILMFWQNIFKVHMWYGICQKLHSLQLLTYD